MVQLVACVFLIVVGAYLGLFVDSGEMRIFGWLVAVIGVFGLVSRSVITRLRQDRQPPTGPR
jgi:uncharacterized membrane protein YfcA